MSDSTLGASPDTFPAMAIYVDPFITYDSDPPPGYSGSGWAHLVSDDSLVDLTGFLTLNVLTIGTAVVRTPLLGSNVTYAALTDDQRTAAVNAGATELSGRACFAKAFDAPPSGHGTYEP